MGTRGSDCLSEHVYSSTRSLTEIRCLPSSVVHFDNSIQTRYPYVAPRPRSYLAANSVSEYFRDDVDFAPALIAPVVLAPPLGLVWQTLLQFVEDEGLQHRPQSRRIGREVVAVNIFTPDSGGETDGETA